MRNVLTDESDSVVSKYKRIVRRVKLWVLVAAAIITGTDLVALKLASGLRRDELNYLLLYLVVGGLAVAALMLLVDLLACTFAVVQTSRAGGPALGAWRTLKLFAEAFLAPCVLWLLLWLALYASKFI